MTGIDITIINILHILCSIYAVIIGAYILLKAKGTKTHKMWGRSFVLAMMVVNVSAFLFYPKHGFTIFQILALWNLLSVASAVYFVVKKPNIDWLSYHYYFICYAYLGVLAAAVSRIPQVLGLQRSAAEFIAIGVVFSIGAFIIEKNAKRVKVIQKPTSSEA